MLTVSEALAAILERLEPLPVVSLPLRESLGRVLATPAVCDLDSPPFDKSLMDGYAVRAADVVPGEARLEVVEEVMAGQVASRSVEAGQAIRIMTGAPIPAGADAVVPVEQSDCTGNFVTFRTPIPPGRNIMVRGKSMRAGQTILPAGRWIRPQEVGSLAELGLAEVPVHRPPTVAVLSTGDELVEVGERPGPGQIRNSNESMLLAQITRTGGIPVSLGIARDTLAELRPRIAAGLEQDMLLLSGGVSAGKLDLVPGVLESLGVRQVFHKVQLKPGQPLWFGVYDRPVSEEGLREKKTGSSAGEPPASGGRCYVFGLPGNPVSSMVCFELFARTAVRRLMGVTPAEIPGLRARLKQAHDCRGNRPTYHPAHVELTDEGAVVEPVLWQGSADLSGTVEANALVLFPEGDRTYTAGEWLTAYLW